MLNEKTHALQKILMYCDVVSPEFSRHFPGFLLTLKAKYLFGSDKTSHIIYHLFQLRIFFVDFVVTLVGNFPLLAG